LGQGGEGKAEGESKSEKNERQGKPQKKGAEGTLRQPAEKGVEGSDRISLFGGGKSSACPKAMPKRGKINLDKKRERMQGKLKLGTVYPSLPQKGGRLVKKITGGLADTEKAVKKIGNPRKVR